MPLSSPRFWSSLECSDVRHAVQAALRTLKIVERTVIVGFRLKYCLPDDASVC